MNAWFWKERLLTLRRVQSGAIDGLQAHASVLLLVLLPIMVVAPQALPMMLVGGTVLLMTLFAIKASTCVFAADRELNAAEILGTLPTSRWRQVVGCWAGSTFPAFLCWGALFFVFGGLSLFGGAAAFCNVAGTLWLFGVWLVVVTSTGILCSLVWPARAQSVTTTFGAIGFLYLVEGLRFAVITPETVLHRTIEGFALAAILLSFASWTLSRKHIRTPIRGRRRRPLFSALVSPWRKNPIVAAHSATAGITIGLDNLVVSCMAISILWNALTNVETLRYGLPFLWLFTVVEAGMSGAHWLDRERTQKRWDLLCVTGTSPRTVVTGVVACVVQRQAIEWILPLPMWCALAYYSGQPLVLTLIAIQPALCAVGALAGLTLRQPGATQAVTMRAHVCIMTVLAGTAISLLMFAAVTIQTAQLLVLSIAALPWLFAAANAAVKKSMT